MKREDLKIGDVIYVNSKGEITMNKSDIKITITKEITANKRFYIQDIRCFIGRTEDNRKWNSGYILK